jgi:hypothetical protein
MTVKFNIDDKQNVQYAIPLWLRDQQILHALAHVKGRVQPTDEPRSEPAAIVGFGPSLADTWEQVRQFKTIFTCSGSHRFLLDRGIVPTYHVEVDPRAHKIPLLGQPHKDVTYLASSTCHPKYFEHLDGYNVLLWHVFDATDEGIRLLPPGEWSITGGCDVGLRAMTMAAFLGYRDLHIFGLDGCARGDMRHAATHPNGKQKFGEIEYKGKTYFTTPAMLEASKQTAHELQQMPKVRAKFYGEGLTQAMMEDFKHDDVQRPLINVVAICKPELISATYKQLNAQLHHDNLAYGVGGAKHAPTIKRIVEKLQGSLGRTPSILDYGCGKGLLAKELPFPIWEYDPAIPGKDISPRPVDICVCTDVLEHIEPEHLLAVLGDLARVTQQVGYFVIHTGPSSKLLADGRNTHLIQQPVEWWVEKLKMYFDIPQHGVTVHAPQVTIVVGPKQRKKKSGVKTVEAL